MGESTSVYRYYDARGLLIYVGITSRGITRQLEHNQHSEWWRYVARQEVEHFETRGHAANRERQLIQDEAPPFNTVHNGGRRGLRQAYLTMYDPDRLRELGLVDAPADELEVLLAGLQVIGEALWSFSCRHIARAEGEPENDRYRAAYETTWVLSDMRRACLDYPEVATREAMVAVFDALFTNDWNAVDAALVEMVASDGDDQAGDT